MLVANDNSGQTTQNPWRLILMVALPFWIYAALSRNLALQMWQQGGVLMGVAPLSARLAQHLVLLLVALPLYRVHLYLGFAPGSSGLSIALANTVSAPAGGKIQLGLGLSMTRERLATLLGPAATVVVGTAADGRFRVLLKFPSHAHGDGES